MLDVRRLKVLAEVARHGSFTAAARSLSYTPSAISQQVAALEREAGTTLVERGPRGVVLTEPGRVLAREADEILGRLAGAELELQALAGLRAGLLRLGWFATAGATLMPHDIAVRPLQAKGLSRQVRAALPPGAYRPPAAMAMLEVLREVCERLVTDAAR